jgi:helicase
VTLPDDYIQAENSAAAMLRGQNLSPMSNGHMYAVAQNIMGSFQRSEALGRPVMLHDQDTALPLMAAARILQALLKSQQKRRLSADVLRRTCLLASCAYAMTGNLPSAAAVQREISLSDLASGAEVVATAICNPASLPQLLALESVEPDARSWLEALNSFLITGEMDRAQRLRPDLERLAVKYVDMLDVALIASARLALAHVVHLSVARILKGATPFMRDFGARLIEARRPCLLPPQYDLLVTQRFAQSDKNGIVTLPTSGGKTLIAEFAIAQALKDAAGLAIYVVPYVALGSQVADTLKAHFPVSTRIHTLFGGFKADAPLNPATRREIVVATPERLDARLRTGDLYEHLRIVVFDEAHVIENGTRGTRIEALIARLRMQQTAGHNFRLVLLSAVLTEVAALCAWLGSDVTNVKSVWRPTARRISIWQRSHRLSWLYENDPMRPAGRLAGDILVQSVLTWPQPIYPTDKYHQILGQKPRAYANAGYLARYMVDLLGGPILVVCGTKATTRELASALAADIPALEVTPPTIIAIIAYIERRAKHLVPLAKMLARGVTYHNASLPMELRRMIERAIRNREIRYTCATTTLAEGVDLPFRSTILFDWLIGFGDRQAPMPAILFRNIAGRCGRAGEFVEGDTVIFDNVFGNLKYTHDSLRWSAQTRVLTDPPALESTIANDNLPSEEREAVRAVISSQFIAAIPENPKVVALEEHFASHLYARYRGRDAIQILRQARAGLLDDSEGEPFARAASPMQLTALGRAANLTGLSAQSVRRLMSFLVTLPDGLELDDLVVRLACTAGVFPEQNNVTFAKLAAGTLKRSYFVATDLKALCAQWRQGVSFEEMFIGLPKAKASSSAVSPKDWAEGLRESEFVAGQYDKFIEVMEYAFGVFLPWMLRACNALAQVVDSPVVRSRDWLQDAAVLEDARLADLEAIDREIEGQG